MDGGQEVGNKIRWGETGEALLLCPLCPMDDVVVVAEVVVVAVAVVDVVVVAVTIAHAVAVSLRGYSWARLKVSSNND